MPHLTLVWLGSKVEQVFMHVNLNLALTILSLPLSYYIHYAKDNNLEGGYWPDYSVLLLSISMYKDSQ